MMRLCLRFPLGVLAVLLIAAAPAAAQDCKAPPGTAAVDQYCESLPSATGDGDSGSGGSQGADAPRSTVRSLERSGESGKELTRFLGQDSASARADAGGKTREDAKSGSRSRGGESEALEGKAGQPSSNPLDAVQSAVSSGAKVGDGFIWAMVVITLLMVGIAWMRYRRGSSS